MTTRAVDVDWEWPGGARVAVSLTFDVDAEAGFLGDGEEFARRLTSLSEGRFGVTRGVPRILDLLRRYSVRATFFIPGYTAEKHPAVVADIPETFALLLEHEFLYDSSFMGDDRPYFEEWDGKRILELPVHWSLDDWPRFGWGIDSGGNMADAEELRHAWRAEYGLARDEGRHLTLTMHPEVIGRGYRFLQLEKLVGGMADDGDVWFARMDEVAAHVRERIPAEIL
jgi:peptidoglycan/xylan/chitin deacetylase (PgdA/CDA1 family)